MARSAVAELTIRLRDELSRPAAIVSNSLKGLRGDVQAFKNARIGLDTKIKAVEQKWSNVRGEIVASALLLTGFALAMRAPISAATDLESKFEDIRQKIDGSRETMKTLRDDIFKIAPQVNRSVSEMASGFDNLVGAGLSEDVSKGLLTPIGKVSTAYRSTFDDVSKMAIALNQNMKVGPEEMLKVFDALAKTGKAGSFELKDMAVEFPSLGAQAGARGITGLKGASDIGAALQIVRRGAGTSSEAATNLSDLLGKMDSQATVNAFEKQLDFPNLRERLKKLTDTGMSPIEASVRITMEATKGDASKIGLAFADKQARAAMTSLFAGLQDYIRIRTDAETNSAGTVDTDFAARMETSAAKFDKLWNAVERLSIAIGEALLPVVANLADKLAPIVDRMAELISAYPQLTAAVVGVTAALIGLSTILAVARGAALLATLGGLKGARGLLGLLGLAMGVGGGAAAGAGAAAGGAAAGAAGTAARVGPAAAGAGAVAAGETAAAAKGAGWLGRGLRVGGKFIGWAGAAMSVYDFGSWLQEGLAAAAKRQPETFKRVDAINAQIRALQDRLTQLPAEAYAGKDFTFGGLAGFRPPERAADAGGFRPLGPVGEKRLNRTLSALPSAYDKPFDAAAAAAAAAASARRPMTVPATAPPAPATAAPAAAPAASIPIPVAKPEIGDLLPAAEMRSQGTAAGQAIGQALADGMKPGLAEIEALGLSIAARIREALSFTARPTISPIIRDGDAQLRGIHADVGIAGDGVYGSGW